MKVPIQRSNEEITAIYNRHVDTIYRVCYMFLKNAPDAEDAVQTVFLKLIRSGPTLTDSEHEKAWLIVTAQNHCKNALKYWWKRKRSAFGGMEASAYAPEFSNGEVLDLLLALPDKYKIVLYLFYYEGYPSKEIAGLLGLKDGTVRARLSSGRNRLRHKIQGGLSFEERPVEQFD